EVADVGTELTQEVDLPHALAPGPVLDRTACVRAERGELEHAARQCGAEQQSRDERRRDNHVGERDRRVRGLVRDTDLFQCCLETVSLRTVFAGRTPVPVSGSAPASPGTASPGTEPSALGSAAPGL